MEQLLKVVLSLNLLGTAITIGDGTAGTDIAITFDGETNDGDTNMDGR